MLTQDEVDRMNVLFQECLGDQATAAEAAVLAAQAEEAVKLAVTDRDAAAHQLTEAESKLAMKIDEVKEKLNSFLEY